MGYLDNSSSIILDAVLSDTGRYRLAKGDGSFRVSKYALFDDEIDYSLYDKSHASGSAYYDLEILQLPVFEAWTNNTSVGKSKLITIARNNLLYLPIIEVNQVFDSSTQMHASGTFMVATNATTEDNFGTVQGVMYGETKGGDVIRVDQGLDTIEISPAFALDADLVETQYIVEIDNRFGKIISTKGEAANVSYIDDDDIASYFLSLGTDTDFVSENDVTTVSTSQTIDGPRGTILHFQIMSSLQLNTSNHLFTKLGSTINMVDKNGTTRAMYYIDSFVTVTGATTGASVQIPVRFIKQQ